MISIFETVVKARMKYCPQCQQKYSDAQRFCLEDGELLSLRDPYHLVGRTLADKYRLDALVGVGGMGAVYRAYHLGLDRRVAFKILLPHLALGNERTIDLFEREAKMAGRLFHENIVSIFDAGRTPDEIAYIAMEWLDGRTLEEELLASGPLSFGRTAEILRQMASALEEAHAKHIIHRDLKPSNVMILRRADGREQVKVLDFGIGKVISDTAGAAVSTLMGTPHYASPEQFQIGGQIDRRSDIYSLGVLLYQMLTGALPFNAASVHELIRSHTTVPPPPLRSQRPDAPAAIEQLVARMLAKEPDRRPQRASEVSALFDQALGGPQVRQAETLIDGLSPQTQLQAREATHRLATHTAATPGLPTPESPEAETRLRSKTDARTGRRTPSEATPRPQTSRRSRVVMIALGLIAVLVSVLAVLRWGNKQTVSPPESRANMSSPAPPTAARTEALQYYLERVA